MASLLALGGGAGEGLQTILNRMMLEEQVRQKQQQIDEEVRSNKAREGLTGRQIDEMGLLRQATLANTKANQAAQQQNQLRDDVRARVQLRPIGADVPPSELSMERDTGMIPAGNYKYTPPSEGMSTAQGEVGATPEKTTWTGTPAQIAAQERIDKPAAEKTSNTKPYMLKGKPIIGVETPQGRVVYQGQDVTDTVTPYVSPERPDRVLVQSGDVYIPRSQAAGKPLATTSSTRTMSEGARMLEPHIDSLKNQAEALDQAGLFGPIMSRVRQALTKAGTIDEFTAMVNNDPQMQADRRAGQFATSLGLLATGAGRVHGGARGGGSPQMYAHFKAMLSDASTLDMFLGRLDAVDEYMQGYAAGPGGTHGQSDSGGLPTVGGTFQGGRVLSVTPIK